ncbi:hypothetical protein CALCODRAFT_518592 [Calocera cornea HHB12733]|uniref:Uncharacterized protein n=1 Tax=Calocera cornea HHB12733 TaxID=1353952 RepID=A0A165EWR9_9BASI|nr:hypothetical protein CALCODRAFT_518592 [Calocera cornea HHB12733]
MFSHQLAQSARLTVRRSPAMVTRSYTAAPSPKPTGIRGLWAQVPVEAYPLVGIVCFVCCVGVGFGIHAMQKEQENFMEHKSAGNPGVKYH